MDMKEMKNEDMEKVTGGGILPKVMDGDKTLLICSNCGHTEPRSVDCFGEVFMCPKCYKYTLVGNHPK